MKANLRDTPLRRFSTFFWGLSLFVVFGIACFFITRFTIGEKMDNDTIRGKERLILRDESRKKEAEAMKTAPEATMSKASSFLNFTPTSDKPHGKF